MSATVVYDDGGGALAPLTDLRPAFEVRAGARSAAERLASAAGGAIDAVFVPEPIAPVVSTRWSGAVNQLPPGEDALFLNGRCALPPQGLDALEVGSALLEPGSGEVIAARLGGEQARRFIRDWRLPEGARAREHDSPVLLHEPWDVVRFQREALSRDLEMLTRDAPSTPPSDVTIIGDHSVSIDESVRMYPRAVIDAEKGPVRIDARATIRPGAVIVGPAFIGRGSTVVENAIIKAGSAIGPVCKVGGEVGAVTFQGYANKAHGGHLGDAWIGQWVNIGAATNNSNLLNTYGEVKASRAPGEARRPTGMTFLGCVLGDHVKTAIGVRLMTGAVVGTGAMLARVSPPPAVGPFAWLTEDRKTLYDFDKFLESARRMMARREVEPTQVLIERLRALHERSGEGRP